MTGLEKLEECDTGVLGLEEAVGSKEDSLRLSESGLRESGKRISLKAQETRISMIKVREKLKDQVQIQDLEIANIKQADEDKTKCLMNTRKILKRKRKNLLL